MPVEGGLLVLERLGRQHATVEKVGVADAVGEERLQEVDAWHGVTWGSR